MSTDPEVLDKIKRACSPQKAIYDMAEYMGGYDADIIGAVDTANKASQDASAALSTVNTVRATADNALSTANQATATASNAASTASAAQTAAANAQTTANKGVSDAAAALEAGNKGIADAANALAASNRVKTIADSALAGANAAVNGLDVTSDQSTVSVTATKNTGSPDVNSLPVASAASAGVMNSATFLAVEGLNSRVAALENEIRTYLVVLPNTTPTQTEITTAYRSAYPNAPNPPLDGTVVIDSEKDLFYQWVGGSSQWIKLSGQQIGMFTNSTLGTIKGSITEGQISAEADGTGSLNGYDALKSGIAANTTALGTLTTRVGAVETKNTSQDTTINTNTTNISALTTRVTTAEGEIDTNTAAIAANKVNADKAINNIVVNQRVPSIEITADKNDGTTVSRLISPVSASQAGIVTPTMYNQWNASGGGLSFKNIGILRSTPVGATKTVDVGGVSLKLSSRETTSNTIGLGTVSVTVPRTIVYKVISPTVPQLNDTNSIDMRQVDTPSPNFNVNLHVAAKNGASIADIYLYDTNNKLTTHIIVTYTGFSIGYYMDIITITY